MTVLRTCATAAVCALLAACAALVAPDAPTARPAAAFDLVGRVAVSYDGRIFSSHVRWEHSGPRDEIWLLTPVGQTLAHIVGDAGGATLTGADQRKYSAASVESLTRQALGWELPVARLAYWVQGEIAPGAAPEGVERDAQARITALTQDGWRIAFSHPTAGEDLGRPRRLELARGNHEIRMVIDRWRRDEGTR
ncbi:MAG: outer membrane lipoprotein LolB [Betaproteobacteria bacterium]|nr:outer membrane lipoprotein LolB [Betaproteobacteria bacterium]